jgi:hypothetical protein
MRKILMPKQVKQHKPPYGGGNVYKAYTFDPPVYIGLLLSIIMGLAFCLSVRWKIIESRI